MLCVELLASCSVIHQARMYSLLVLIDHESGFIVYENYLETEMNAHF